MTIHLSGLPECASQAKRTDRPYILLDLAPGGVYLATGVTSDAGALLPHRFTLTGAANSPGGLFSVALSCESPRLAVSQHLVLWSPDLPRQIPHCWTSAAVTRLTHRRCQATRFRTAVAGSGLGCLELDSRKSPVPAP